MANGFNTTLRRQREWSWLLAIDFFLSGIGGGLFLLHRSLFLPPWVGILAVLLVLAGGIVLLSELGHPLRAWRAIFRPQTSWISRGVFCVSLFVVAALLSLAPSFSAFSWIPGRTNAQFLDASGLVACLCAIFITLYPAFVLGSSPSIPFWDTPYLPLVFFAQALLGASGTLLLVSGPGSLAGLLPKLHSMSAIMIVINLAAILAYFAAMSRAGTAEKESVRLLNHGGLGWALHVGVILVGMILPLLLMALSLPGFLAGACILAGGLLFRVCILKAGVYVPSALVGLDMSGLKGDRSNFALEYADWTVTGPGSSAQK